jgi:glutathione synthase/RimK-type ligase-like ATP-grasp enzyme
MDEILKGHLGDQMYNMLSKIRNRNIYFLPYAPSLGLEKFIQKYNLANLKILANSSKMRDKFEDKIRTRALLQNLGITVPSGEVSRIDSLDFNELKNKYGLPFVIQLPFGTSGSGTRFIFDKFGLDEFSIEVARNEKAYAIVAKYVHGVPMNANAVIWDGEVILSPPSFQVIGPSECSNHSEAYCGNDYAAAAKLDFQVKTRISSMFLTLGKHLSNTGYKGIFGIDFILTDNEVVAIEINPRFQGSTQLMTLGQIQAGIDPIVRFHVLSCLGIIRKERLERNYLELSSNSSIGFSSIILHNLSTSESTVGKMIRSGIYRLERGRLIYLRTAINILDLKADDEFLITAGVPLVGTRVWPNVLVCKILFRITVTHDGYNLLPYPSQVANAINKEFSFSPYQELPEKH